MLQQHLEKLPGFYSIALHGSFLKGAQELGISQPALTKSIQNLEQALGSTLFVRHQRGVKLTDAGLVLKEYCEKLFADLPDLQARLSQPTKMSGVLRVGTYETLGLVFWPSALAMLAKAFPELQIQITTSSPDTLWERLDSGVLNLIVDAEPPVNSRYFSKVLYTDHFGLFYREDMATKFKNSAELPMSYVKRTWDQNGNTLKELLEQNSLSHRLVYDLDSFVSVKAVIEEGLAVGVLPLAFANHQRKVKLREFEKGGRSFRFGAHRICVTCLESERKDPRVIELSKALKLAAAMFSR